MLLLESVKPFAIYVKYTVDNFELMQNRKGSMIFEEDLSPVEVHKMENCLRLMGDFLKACAPMRDIHGAQILEDLFKEMWQLIN